MLQQCQTTGALLPEILVTEGFVSDWELSRVCSDLFHIPYLPVECYPPSEEARQGFDPDFLRQYGLVPLDRFGDLVTVAMPGVVPTEVLEVLGGGDSGRILPVVGSVVGNRRFIDEHFPAAQTTTAPLADLEAGGGQEDDSWASLFDDADQAVNLDLGGVLDEVDDTGNLLGGGEGGFDDDFTLDIEIPGEGEAA